MQKNLLNITESTKISEVLNHSLKLMCLELAETTIKGHSNKCEQIKDWIGNNNVGDFSEKDWIIFEVKLHEYYSVSSISKYMEVIRPAINLLIASGFLEENPLGKQKTSVTPSAKDIVPPKDYSENDIERLVMLRSCHEPEIWLLMFMLTTGLRIGELLALNVESYHKDKRGYLVDITLATNKYKMIKKGKTKRWIKLPDIAVTAIESLIKLAENRSIKEIPVILTDNNTIECQPRTLLAFNSLRNETFKKVDDFALDFFRSHCLFSNVQYITPMNLRHTFGSQSLLKGVDLSWVAQQMGHTEKELINKGYNTWVNKNKKTYDEIDNHYIQQLVLPVIEAANDDSFEQIATHNKNTIWHWFVNTFFKKAS